MNLIIHVDGATAEEFERGVAAAQAVFDSARVTPYEAAAAHFARAGWDLGGCEGDGPSDAVMERAALWHEADLAAAQACCATWSALPESADLEVRMEEIPIGV